MVLIKYNRFQLHHFCIIEEVLKYQIFYIVRLLYKIYNFIINKIYNTSFRINELDFSIIFKTTSGSIMFQAYNNTLYISIFYTKGHMLIQRTIQKRLHQNI